MERTASNRGVVARSSERLNCEHSSPGHPDAFEIVTADLLAEAFAGEGNETTLGLCGRSPAMCPSDSYISPIGTHSFRQSKCSATVTLALAPKRLAKLRPALVKA